MAKEQWDASTKRWVPTGAELDEGYDPGIVRERRGPLRRLKEALAPKRVVRHDVRLEAGVGEAREVAAPPRIEAATSLASARSADDAIVAEPVWVDASSAGIGSRVSMPPGPLAADPIYTALVREAASPAAAPPVQASPVQARQAEAGQAEAGQAEAGQAERDRELALSDDEHNPSEAVTSSPPPPKQPRRATRIAEGVIPDEVESANEGSRVGIWPKNLSDTEMNRRIGPVQQYGDDT